METIVYCSLYFPHYEIVNHEVFAHSAPVTLSTDTSLQWHCDVLANIPSQAGWLCLRILTETLMVGKQKQSQSLYHQHLFVFMVCSQIYHLQISYNYGFPTLKYSWYDYVILHFASLILFKKGTQNSLLLTQALHTWIKNLNRESAQNKNLRVLSSDQVCSNYQNKNCGEAWIKKKRK